MAACYYCRQMGYSECVPLMPKAPAHPPSRTVEEVVERLTRDGIMMLQKSAGCFSVFCTSAFEREFGKWITDAIAIVRESMPTVGGGDEMEFCQQFADSLPPHKGSLHLTHNQHKGYYETIEQYYANIECPPDWVSDEQRLKAIETDSVWALQWYPDTPVGFFTLLACDLGVLLAAAKEVV